MPATANYTNKAGGTGQTRADKEHDHDDTAFPPPTRYWIATRHARARLRRLATVLAAVICGLLASAAAVPAAFARMEPDPGAGYVAPASVPAQVRTILAGGMPGWQITLIATGAALAAAALAVLADRKLTTRSGATTT